MRSVSSRGPGARRPAATIADVAAAAGVSRATVSRVMNGRSSVEAALAARVREAAEALSYRPSNVARNLALGRTRTVAVVVPDLASPVFQQILRGVMAGAAEDGYRVLVADSEEDEQLEAAVALDARQRCDALVLVSPRLPDHELAKLVEEVEPVVLVNRALPAEGGVTPPSLVFDYADATVQVVEHLVGLGHRRLAYLAGPGSLASDEQRTVGLARARTAHPDVEVHEIPAGPDVAAGHRATAAVLASRATAALAVNDLVAFGLLAGLNEAGVAVPADISVTGFDDIDLARYATPALTTAAVPQAELGRHAWRELHAVMEDEQPARTTQFAARLEVRASTGPVPRGPERVHVTDDAVPASAPPAPPSRAAVGPVPSLDLHWSATPDAVVLAGPQDAALARQENGGRLPRVHAPRPYLHPVHTLAGVALTDAGPVDHRHHYGVGIAVPDVNGTSYWGGRTFVEHVGPTLLANHGRQVPAGAAPDPADPATLVDTVTWRDERDQPQIVEERRLTAHALGGVEGWALEWHSVLHAAHGPLEIRSPATNGRPGAGYGGLFWRLPVAESTQVLSVGGSGETLAHGGTSPWVAFVQRHAGVSTTLLLVQPGPVRPWFLRSAEYPGACPALAWDAPLVVPDGGSVQVGLVAALLDTALTRDDAAALAEELR